MSKTRDLNILGKGRGDLRKLNRFTADLLLSRRKERSGPPQGLSPTTPIPVFLHADFLTMMAFLISEKHF
jgi:hypothetical protein